MCQYASLKYFTAFMILDIFILNHQSQLANAHFLIVVSLFTLTLLLLLLFNAVVQLPFKLLLKPQL